MDVNCQKLGFKLLKTMHELLKLIYAKNDVKFLKIMPHCLKTQLILKVVDL